ncbi:tagaturonate reductase [[Clostridium] fimetarium]|uniref:Tagaturonate reductase n=1 Tax=[Clostridium] fimetarium TaxID=99656 RepID=A0A1I0QP12_9FIRM|nr:tagaturonate reductase [[Clostridium] fimetarium]SEW28920.1 tagaturonate reductase [[Clostridium] fimetarium]
MQRLNKQISKAVDRPVKVLQFGEGNFLRAFVDYMFDVTNEKTDFNGGVVIVKPIQFGNLDRFHEQECQYTLQLRGFENGQPKKVTRIITSVVDAVAAIEDYQKYEDYAKCETLRFVVSNTTEAGIVFDETDDFNALPPKTYPGKLTKILFDRFKAFNGAQDKGLILIPCELIADNGINLKKCIMQFVDLWELGDEFKAWLESACSFCSTLVDRIVPGYPRDEADALCEEFGYEDQLIVTAEIFGLWVIESDKDLDALRKELPFNEAGLPVVFTKDHHPYKERKVRILNGSHTSFVLASFLAGNDLVKQSMDDPTIRKYMEETLFDEVIPTLSLSPEDCKEFAAAVSERFQNPFIKHKLLDISLNSVSKWEARCLPSFLGYVEKFGKLPKYLTFSIAALMSFYTSQKAGEMSLVGNRNGEEYTIRDDKDVLDFFKANSSKSPKEFTQAFLSTEKFFGQDLTKVSGLVDAVTSYITDIRAKGMRAVVEELVK